MSQLHPQLGAAMPRSESHTRRQSSDQTWYSLGCGLCRIEGESIGALRKLKEFYILCPLYIPSETQMELVSPV
jgi:hypothetical protein